MATPTLSPTSATSTVVLTSTGSVAITGNGSGNPSHYPFGIYADPDADLYDVNFVNGASDQVAYTYKKLGGDVLDIELTAGNIYASYEEAVLEYSYIVNVHQSKNILHSSLGATTGTFDSDGQRTDASKATNVETKYPKFKFGYNKRLMDHASTQGGIGGTLPMYSSSFSVVHDEQDYDLQAAVSESSTESDSHFYNKVGNKKITIRRVYFKTPHAMWRFYGYYGGMNTVGNMSTYGMYADDSTFEIIPPWQNKLQAMAYEDAIYTRNSHYSYEIRNNKIRLYPVPGVFSTEKIWFEFTVQEEPWDDQDDRENGVSGVNNMNTLPLANIPYQNINSIGKQWIRRFSLALAKETLGQIRSKFGQIPIPGNNVTLNGDKLITEARDEQKSLREELQKVLDELTYEKITEIQKNMVKNTQEAVQAYPYFIYQG
tara:strand:- start:18161 stop:19450 length:1290 start_codon:yes stop_codon:yes gene_type:complete